MEMPVDVLQNDQELREAHLVRELGGPVAVSAGKWNNWHAYFNANVPCGRLGVLDCYGNKLERGGCSARNWRVFCLPMHLCFRLVCNNCRRQLDVRVITETTEG